MRAREVRALSFVFDSKTIVTGNNGKMKISGILILNRLNHQATVVLNQYIAKNMMVTIMGMVSNERYFQIYSESLSSMTSYSKIDTTIYYK